jgi:hypothetical protein
VTIICDEAKSIPDPIFEAFSGRCTFNGLLYISSTGEGSGAFARSQDDGSDFVKYHITYEDCQHVLDSKRVEALRAFYPEDDPFLRSTLYQEGPFLVTPFALQGFLFLGSIKVPGRGCEACYAFAWISNLAFRSAEVLSEKVQPLEPHCSDEGMASPPSIDFPAIIRSL